MSGHEQYAAEPRGRRAPEPGSWWTLGWAWGASVAAGALLAWSFSLRHQNNDLRQTIVSLEQLYARQQQQLNQAQDVLATLTDPTAAQFTLTSSAARRQPQAKAIYRSGHRNLVFLASNLPALPPQKTYELWLIPSSGAPIAAGLFKPDVSGSATIINMQGPSLAAGTAAKAFAVTVEPEGGSAAPTSHPIISSSGV